MDAENKVCLVLFIIAFVLGCVFGGIVWGWVKFEDHFKHGYGQAIIDTKEGNPPRYKLFCRGDGTMTWIENKVGVR